MDLTLKMTVPASVSIRGNKGGSPQLQKAFESSGQFQLGGFSGKVAPVSLQDVQETPEQVDSNTQYESEAQFELVGAADEKTLVPGALFTSIDGADAVAQAEGFSQVNQRVLLPTSSLLADKNGISVNADVINDAVRLSHFNANANTNTNANSLPSASLSSSAAVNVDRPNQNLLALISTNAIHNDLTEKTIEWAKVDLSSVNQSESKAAASSRIGEKLLNILQDRINIQASNNIKTAQIRLDPPDLGHIKLSVAIEGDKVSVSIVSQNSVVREALMQTSERLRHELVNQNFINVSVDISSDSEGQANPEQQTQEQIMSNAFNAADELTRNSQDEFIAKI